MAIISQAKGEYMNKVDCCNFDAEDGICSWALLVHGPANGQAAQMKCSYRDGYGNAENCPEYKKTRLPMPNEGIIELDSISAKVLGFTGDNFNPGSYLWRTGDVIIISFIIAKKKGVFCNLIKRIVKLGFYFEIPTPSNRMFEIAEKQKWRFCKKADEIFGEVEYLTNREDV